MEGTQHLSRKPGSMEVLLKVPSTRYRRKPEHPLQPQVLGSRHRRRRLRSSLPDDIPQNNSCCPSIRCSLRFLGIDTAEEDYVAGCLTTVPKTILAVLQDSCSALMRRWMAHTQHRDLNVCRNHRNMCSKCCQISRDVTLIH